MDSTTTTTSLHSIFKSVIQSFNTLLDCPLRFSGEYNGQRVHNFIEYIEYYKRIKCITDKQALLELQHLLTDEAHIWWIRRKSNLITWAEALTMLENQYSKYGPADMTDKEKSLSSEDIVVDEFRTSDELNTVPNTQRLFQEENKEPENIADIETSKTLTSNIGIETFEADGIPKSVLDQLIVMINQGARSYRKKKVKFVLDLPNNGSYKVILRKSGRHTIRLVPNKIAEEKSYNKQQSQIQNINPAVNNDENNEIFNINEREATIKVRRTEDLMPQIIDIEESSTKEIKDEVEQIEEFIANDVECSINNLHGSGENLQIDSDLMSQINNIINESEMNMQTLDHNQEVSTISSVLPDTGSAIAYLYNGETTIQTECVQPKSPPASLSKIHSTIKKSNRCSFCRNKGHSYKTCLKKAKQDKRIADCVVTTTSLKKSEFLKETEMSCSPSKDNDNEKTSSTPKISLINTRSLLNNSPTTFNSTDNISSEFLKETEMSCSPSKDNEKTSSTPKISLINTRSLPNNSPTTFNSTDNISSLLNNIPEKCINSLLTTKLINPISGPTPNKVMAAKLRSTKVSMPKCHQCGTLGFYKSICPKCSPIYNNQNKQ